MNIYKKRTRRNETLSPILESVRISEFVCHIDPPRYIAICAPPDEIANPFLKVSKERIHSSENYANCVRTLGSDVNKRSPSSPSATEARYASELWRL